MGQPNRGKNYPMFLQSYSPSGNAMFFYSDIPEDIENSHPLFWIDDAPDLSDWVEVSNSPLNELGGGSTGGGPDETELKEYEPENGPISAIVFEIDKPAK